MGFTRLPQHELFANEPLFGKMTGLSQHQKSSLTTLKILLCAVNKINVCIRGSVSKMQTKKI